jgi:hypothetical protein
MGKPVRRPQPRALLAATLVKDVNPNDHEGESRYKVDFDGNSIIAFTGVVAGVTWLCAMLPASADEHEIPRVAFPSSML